MADDPSEAVENTPALWLVIGVALTVLGAIVIGLAEGDMVRVLGLLAAGVGGIALTIGAVGYGVLIALRQHHSETGGR